MKTGDFKWTQESVDKILQMYKHGDSASQIAKALGNGLTRNAIIGKLNRLRDKGLRPELTLGVISFKKAQGQIINRTNAAKLATPYLAKPKAVLFQFPKPVPKPKPKQEVVVVQEPTGEHAARLAYLRKGGCKWITEDFEVGHADDALMCGEIRQDGSSYCAHHKHMASANIPPSRMEASNRGLKRLGVFYGY